MREGTITPNYTDLVQRSLQIGAPQNIELRETWFTPYLEEDPSENPNNEPRVFPENNRNTLTALQYEPQVKESTVSEGESSFHSTIIQCAQ